MKKHRSWAILLVVIALLVAACNGDDESGADDSGSSEGDGSTMTGAAAVVEGNRLDAIKDRGELIVGMTLQFEPQMYRDANDQPAGYDVELVKMLAADLGVELNIQDLEFDALIPGMLAGQFDLISVGLVGRPARLEQLWFTCPYVPYRQVVVVNNEAGITSLDQLNSSDVTMTALQGSTAANLIETEFPDATLVGLEQGPAFLEVASGRADAIVVEEYLAIPFVEENQTTSVLNPDNPFSQEYGAWAVPRGDIVWKEYVNGWLGYYISNGTLDQMYTDIIGPTEGLPACS